MNFSITARGLSVRSGREDTTAGGDPRKGRRETTARYWKPQGDRRGRRAELDRGEERFDAAMGRREAHSRQEGERQVATHHQDDPSG